MTATSIHALRARLCSAIADLGGVSERLSELEQAERGELALTPAAVQGMRQEMADWLVQAGETLTKAAAIAEMGE